MRRSGVRIPLPPVYARIAEESVDCRAVVTVLSSSRGRNGFEDLVENDEKFSHDGSQGEFVRFAFGAQTLVKRREDMITTSRGQRCHVEAAAQSATAAKDGALAT